MFASSETETNMKKKKLKNEMVLRDSRVIKNRQTSTVKLFFVSSSYLEKNVRLLMESVDELCQDANKFNNHLRNVARQQQQKDAYIQRRVSYLFRSLVYTDIVLIVGFTKLFSFHGLPDIIFQNSLTFPLMKTKFP